MMNRHPVPSLDAYLSELLREDQHIVTQATMEHRASGIFMNQHKYIEDFITLAGLEDTSSVDTPMEVNVKYRKDERDLLDDPTLYRRLVGSLIYLTTTRLDISYIVHLVSQFMTSPRHLHLVAVRRIIRYLRGSLLVGCSSLPAPLFNLLPIVMLIGLGVQIHVDLLRLGVCV